jgi:tellurite resistance protein TehA-like permease
VRAAERTPAPDELENQRKMNPIAVWILFGLGIVFLIVGAGLMIYGAVQKRAHFDGVAPSSDVDKVLDAISKLFDTLGRFIGPSRVARVGLILIVVGLILIFVPLYAPTHAAAAHPPSP